MTIAYLGPEHTNTHLAALKRFGRRARYVHAPTVDHVFQLVEQRRVKCGVVPVENSLQGAVAHTLDYFIREPKSAVRIHGEIQHPVTHHLITMTRLSPKELRKVHDVWSHPQALAQCALWLRQHLPGVTQHETNSTAEAVWTMMRSDGAAIGTREIAQEQRLSAMRISLSRENTTRFLILGLGRAARGRRHKTSVLFGLKDQPGALYDALLPFKRSGINLTKIESRPSQRRAWEYLFFIDLEGSETDKSIRHALSELRRCTTRCNVLGSYPVTR